MITKIIEATNGPNNWGKFLVGRFDAAEWVLPSRVVPRALLKTVGWTDAHLLVLDLQTGEGAVFRPGGLASADLNKHKIWVCPLYEPFLNWLYTQDLTDLSVLPYHINLPDAEFQMHGYRREGPVEPYWEAILRREWWLRHGHKGQYGDDGEMQCAACASFGAWDYKREPLEKLEAVVNAVRLQLAVEAIARMNPVCENYSRPEGVLGGPCVTCGASQPEHALASFARGKG